MGIPEKKLCSAFLLVAFLLAGVTGTSNEIQSVEQTLQLPTLYEYFLPPGGDNVTGLTAEQDGFRLNGKLIRLVSGAIHYFRIHPDLWRDRLRKLRATGANTVETYVAWNLHEPIKGQFDFGEGNNDMSLFLNVRRFIQIAQEEDLLVLLRPGPYICSEFEFGGLPSWLLRDPLMEVRTAYQPYLDRVKIYLDNFLPQVNDLQFTQGGPIIALQIENEYASFDKIDKSYLELIQQTYFDNGIDSLLFTSDGSWNGDIGSLPDVLKTANFQSSPESNLDDLLEFQPDKPAMVMEYWAGWFDHWFEGHSWTDVDDFADVLDVILGKYNGSVNFYMWHGGTNFGFNAGANSQSTAPFYAPDVTSYDYDAPLNEHGGYTDKYYRMLEMVEAYQIPVLHRPEMPEEGNRTSYASIEIQKLLPYVDIIEQAPETSKFSLERAVSMEHFPMNEDCGQSRGYVVYRKTIELTEETMFKAGPVKDFGILLISGEIQPYPKDENGTTQYWLNSVQEYSVPVGLQTIDLLIENMGRVNFGGQEDFVQHKGLVLTGNDSFYHLGESEIEDIEVIALEFKSSWVKSLTNWRNASGEQLSAPLIIQSSFIIEEKDELVKSKDTFLDMSSWTKGIAFINGFNLGRYFNVGPQQTLYVPGPFLHSGENTITIFEQLQPGNEIVFTDTPNLGPPIRKRQWT